MNDDITLEQRVINYKGYAIEVTYEAQENKDLFSEKIMDIGSIWIHSVVPEGTGVDIYPLIEEASAELEFVNFVDDILNGLK